MKNTEEIPKRKFQFSVLNFYFITGKEKKAIFENIALMLSSGVDLLSVFTALEKEAEEKGLKNFIGKMREDIENGDRLWQVFEKHKLISALYLPIVRMGEETGKLEENLDIVISYIRREEDFRSRIRSASLYPIFVSVVLLLVGSVVALFILPQLASTYSNLNLDLPKITRVLIDVGVFLDKYGTIVVPAFIASVLIIIFILFFYKHTKFIGQWILFKIPGIGRLIKEVEYSRFGYLLGTLLGAGVPLVKSLKLMQFSTDSRVYRKYYLELAEIIESGKSFEQSFIDIKKSRKLLPVYIRQIISSAEKTGKLQDSLLKIGEVYTRKSTFSSENITALLEPILLVVVWAGVAITAFAVVLPVYTLTSSLGSDTAVEGSESNNASNRFRELSLKDLATIKDEEDGQVVPPFSDITISQSGNGYLNVRSAVGGNVIGQISGEQSYKILEEEGGWYRIELADGKTGWVNGSYIFIQE